MPYCKQMNKCMRPWIGMLCFDRISIWMEPRYVGEGATRGNPLGTVQGQGERNRETNEGISRTPT